MSDRDSSNCDIVPVSGGTGSSAVKMCGQRLTRRLGKAVEVQSNESF
jgi:hypothetical protein